MGRRPPHRLKPVGYEELKPVGYEELKPVGYEENASRLQPDVQQEDQCDR